MTFLDYLHQLELINAEAQQRSFTGSNSPYIDLLTAEVLTACTKQHCVHRGYHSDFLNLYLYFPTPKSHIQLLELKIIEWKAKNILLRQYLKRLQKSFSKDGVDLKPNEFGMSEGVRDKERERRVELRE